jgi:hypothetical protein
MRGNGHAAVRPGHPRPGGNWNRAAVAAAVLAAVTWLALPIPVLVAGLRRILGWPGKRLMAAAWAGAWVAGVALMVLIPASVASGKTLSPVANWQELVTGAGCLTLAAVMAWILARPAA